MNLLCFKKCCKKAIEQIGEIGIKFIINYKTGMTWNRVFRVNEMFPHPNYYIEMGETDEPLFLESFPEAKIKLNEWATLNIKDLNCETIGVKLKQKNLPEIYTTYLQEFKPNNQHLSYHNFLKLFHLKSISDSTIWRWMRYLGFQYCEQKKNIIVTNMKKKKMLNIEKNL